MTMSDGSPDYPTIAADIGLTELRAAYPALTGAGVTVGQVEASSSGASGPTALDFEMDPAQEGQPADNSNDFITYYNGLAQSFTYNDGVVGTYSRHASFVATFFYDATIYDGAPTGVAPGVAHVDNYNAENYLDNLLAGYPDQVVNMSFLYDPSTNEDAVFDAAADVNNTVFVAAAGNGGMPGSPSSAYNVISVDSSIEVQAIGPASDGVPKPDISAPQTVTSRTTAIVSGAATLLVQAGEGGYPGATAQNEADAVDFRVIKALLLNGATKPADYYTTAYAPTASQPLNAVYGAGVVNVFNSVNELYGGEHGAGGSFAELSASSGFTPMSVPATAAVQGWNLGTLTAASGQNEVDRYGFELTSGGNFEATLTWAADASNAIDQLGLYLYNDATGALVASSAAALSNVQQVSLTPVNAGSYDLDVVLMGSAGGSLSDSYALAFAQTEVACFRAGTRIRTPAGEVAVERLQAGDLVLTACGKIRPIRWVGHRRVDCRRHPRAQDVLPLRVRKSAFGNGAPARDLWLSPDHAVFIDDVLIPIRYLVNGRTILHEQVGEVTYYHVELASHDVILADGLACESYLDTGNRAAFANGRGAAMPSADFSRHVWATQACAELVLDGPRVARVKRRLLAQAESLGHRVSARAGLRVLAGEMELRAETDAGRWRVRLPRNAGRVRLASRSWVPAHMRVDTDDTRRLGVAIANLRLDGQAIRLDDARLSGGWQAPEAYWRWTDGEGWMAPAGGGELSFDVVMTGRYWA
jgi:hypothetical protein